MKTEFSATEEPPNEMPPNDEFPPITPGASNATPPRDCATGRRLISSRVMFVAVSVERTSTRFTTREPTTCTASRLATPPSFARLTVVVPPSETLTGTGWPTACSPRRTCRA